MSSYYRILATALVSCLFAAVVVACSTTPSAPDETPLQMSSIEDLLQTDDTLLATRVNPEELSTLTSLLQRLAQSTNNRDFRDFADMSPDPLGYLKSLHDLPNKLPSLAEDQPSYVIVSQSGNDAFLDAAMLGLPTKTEDWPAYFNVRLLLPTDNPESLTGELTPWLDEFESNETYSAYRLFDGPGFVRVELAVNTQIPGTTAGDADEWIDGLDLENLQPPSAADYRPTPAYEAFVASDSPFGVWARAESLSMLGALELLDIFAGDYAVVSEPGKPRYFLHGVARIAAAAVVNDPVSAEHEDLSLLLTAEDDGALAIDVYATRTTQGARVHRAVSGPVNLTGFDTDSPFLDASWQANLDELDDTVSRPFWSTLDAAAGEEEEFGSSFELSGDSNPLLQFSDDPAVLPSLAATLQYPWTSLNTAGAAIADTFPLPRAIAVETFLIDEAMDQFPIGAVLAAAFVDGPEARLAIEQFLSLGERFMPGAFDAALVNRDDDLVELRLAMGKELAEAFSDSSRSRPSTNQLSFNIAAVQNYAAMLPFARGLSVFDFIHLRSHSEEAYQTLRISIGTDEALEAQPVSVNTEALENPTDRCQTEIAAASIEHLSDLRTNPAAHVDRWAQAVEERSEDCYGSDHAMTALIKERIELARELAAEIP